MSEHIIWTTDYAGYYPAEIRPPIPPFEDNPAAPVEDFEPVPLGEKYRAPKK